MENFDYKDYILFNNTQKELIDILSIMDYAKSLCILINQDFVEFSRKNEQHVLCHGERYKDGCVYKFEIPNGYVIYIATEEYKVKSLQICQKEMEQSLATIPE